VIALAAVANGRRAIAGVRSFDPDRGDGGENQPRDHRGCLWRGHPGIPCRPTLATLGPVERVPGLPEVTERLAA